jgi:hypothetical protein
MNNKLGFSCRRLNRFFCACFIGITMAIILTACSAFEVRPPLHGVVTKNVGKERLFNLVITYSENTVFRDLTPVLPGSDKGSYGDYPVPEKMIVSWKTADSKEHKATVQLKGKLNYVEELRAIELWFADEKLEVYQATKSGARGEFTNRRRIYPD